jgi:glycerophosphoryl diester phosphodiesterase
VGKRTFINVEMKNYTNRRDDLVEIVCMLVKKHQMQKRVMFSSFFPTALSKARSYLPGVPRGLLALHGLLGVWARSFGFNFGKYDALHPNLKDFTPQEATRVHRLKRRVHVYTVNKEEDMRRLFKWGVDGIFTDDPQLAVEVRSGSK